MLIARAATCGARCGALTELSQDGTTKVTFVDGDDGKELAVALAHEGQHVLDIDTFLASGQEANGEFDLTQRQREINAYEISSFLGQALGRSSEVKSVPEAKYDVWNKGWSKLEEAERNARRTRGIDALVSSRYVGHPINSPGTKFSEEFGPGR